MTPDVFTPHLFRFHFHPHSFLVSDITSDPSFTSFPVEMRVGGKNGPRAPAYTMLPDVAAFLTPSSSAPAEYLARDNLTIGAIPPNEQLSCLDFLYFASDKQWHFNSKSDKTMRSSKSSVEE